MRQLSSYICVFAMATAVGCGACGATTGGTQTQTAPAPATPVQRATAAPSNPDAAVLADFNARLDRYITLQRALLKEAPLKETNNPAEITVRQEVLASKLRNIRVNAKQGDIFSPPVAALFKRLMAPELDGAERRETRQALEEEDGEVAQVNLKINATWPASEPLTTVPATILANLPQLPRDVEYRISAKRHLILRDVDANIIVDFIYNALR